MQVTELCNVCSERIEQELVENYKDHGLEQELWRCRNCCLNPVGNTRKLFDKCREIVGDKWEQADKSLQAAFILKQIHAGNIQGGAIGELYALRSIAASEV